MKVVTPYSLAKIWSGFPLPLQDKPPTTLKWSYIQVTFVDTGSHTNLILQPGSTIYFSVILGKLLNLLVPLSSSVKYYIELSVIILILSTYYGLGTVLSMYHLNLTRTQ